MELQPLRYQGRRAQRTVPLCHEGTPDLKETVIDCMGPGVAGVATIAQAAPGVFVLRARLVV